MADGHKAKASGRADADRNTYMTEAPQSQRDLGYDIIAVFHPQRLEDPLVIGPLKGAVADAGAAEKDHLIVLAGKVILKIDGAKHSQGRAIGMTADHDLSDLRRDQPLQAAPDLRRLIGVDKAAVHTDLGGRIVIGDGLLKKGKVSDPILPGVGAAKHDGQRAAPLPDKALYAGRTVIDNSHQLAKQRGLHLRIGQR